MLDVKEQEVGPVKHFPEGRLGGETARFDRFVDAGQEVHHLCEEIGLQQRLAAREGDASAAVAEQIRIPVEPLRQCLRIHPIAAGLRPAFFYHRLRHRAPSFRIMAPCTA